MESFYIFLLHSINFILLDKFIHSLENTNVPFNCQEWDDGQGDAEEHRRRMRLNWREGLVIIVINAVFNTSLLIPLCYLGNTLHINESFNLFNQVSFHSLQNAREA